MEEGEALAVVGEVLAGPAGMVDPVEEGLRVGHEAEDPAGGVADAGDGIHGTVGVVRVGHGGAGGAGGAGGEIVGSGTGLSQTGIACSDSDIGGTPNAAGGGV